MPPGQANRAVLEELVGATLEAAWVDYGYTAPNTGVYPWLWLWDSCFHALIWNVLGRSDRATSELDAVFENQDSSGFVPHMGYQLDPQRPLELWGRRRASSLTQPPLFGHVIRVLVEAGVSITAERLDQATAGFNFLFDKRARDETGLLTVVHPWETGCDDSPRWDHFCPGGFDLGRWRAQKMELLRTLEFNNTGAPVANPAFGAAPVSFSALAAWNAIELAAITKDLRLAVVARELADAVLDQWDSARMTWVDAGPAAPTSGRVRTADALLALLVCDRPAMVDAVVGELGDSAAYAGRFGPRGVHPAESVYDPTSYWRGPVWPQIAYGLWRATDALDTTAGRRLAELIRTSTIQGAVQSGLAEYWDGDRGVGGGAIPQSWSGLALVMAL